MRYRFLVLLLFASALLAQAQSVNYYPYVSGEFGFSSGLTQNSCEQLEFLRLKQESMRPECLQGLTLPNLPDRRIIST
jgi:hypothetical protein